VLAFLFDEHHPKELEKYALGAVTAVSILMYIALLRTFRLVMCVLREIVAKHGETPYAFYSKRATRLPNANWFLLVLPAALMIFFGYAFIVSLLAPS
jgi:hypothetical protein